MAYAYPRDGALDYFPCRYGSSRLLFRGPRRDLDAPYIAVLGGTEVYGKFVPRPFPDLLEERLGRAVVNLGCVNGGLDAFLNDPDTLDVARRADCAVVQVLGAQNLTNRFYSVHPRRNDRFVAATADLRALYRDVDFTEFTFTRHLVAVLQARSPTRFAAVARELQAVWLDRMARLLNGLNGRRFLLWLGEAPPPSAGQAADPLETAPFVDAAMIRALRPLVDGIIDVRLGQPGQDISSLAFAPFDAAAAATVPGPADHRRIAEALAPMLTA
jgi:hypothetical protein